MKPGKQVLKRLNEEKRRKRLEERKVDKFYEENKELLQEIGGLLARDFKKEEKCGS